MSQQIMKLMECSRRLLLQTAFTKCKLSDGWTNRSISMKHAMSYTTCHLAVRNVFYTSSYNNCSCSTKHYVHTRTLFHLHLERPYSDSLDRKTKCAQYWKLQLAGKISSRANHTLFPCSLNSQNFVSSHGPYRNFWSKSKSENSKPDELVKQDETEPEKMTLYQRFKHMYKNYWYVLIPVHVVTSIGWGGMFYYIASSGFDIPAFLETVGASQKIIDMMKNSPTGYVAIAYTMYKVATPVRYSVTLGGTTMTIKYLVKHGLIKPVDSQKIKQMYTETKDQLIEKQAQLKEKKDSLKENIMEKRSQVLSHMTGCNKKLTSKISGVQKSNKNE